MMSTGIRMDNVHVNGSAGKSREIGVRHAWSMVNSSGGLVCGYVGLPSNLGRHDSLAATRGSSPPERTAMYNEGL
jgi:hypothetical protein